MINYELPRLDGAGLAIKIRNTLASNGLKQPIIFLMVNKDMPSLRETCLIRGLN